MAIHDGSLTLTPTEGFVNSDLELAPNAQLEVVDQDFSKASLSADTPSLLSVAFLPGQVWVTTLPIASAHRTNQPPLAGSFVPTFTDDMYNRLWFIPDPVDFGYILAETEREFVIWNAYFIDMTCVGVTYSDPLQFSVDGPQPTFMLPAIAQYNYVATAYAEGGFQFNVLSTWDFQSEDLLGSFIGVRVVVLDYEPLYKGGMKESIEYSTDIIQSMKGKEQRIQTRQLPRKEVSFKFRIETERINADWEATLFQWQKKAFGVPMWGQAETHTETITAGDTVINVDTRYAEYINDGLAVIWQGRDNYEPVQVKSFTDAGIVTAFPIISTYTGEKVIIPVTPCYMNRPAKYTPTPDEDSIVRVSLIGINPEEDPEDWTFQRTFNGLPVLIRASIVRERGMTRTMDAEMEMVDYDTGPFAIYSNKEFNRQITGHRFRRETKEDCWELRQMYHYLKGMQKPMFIPTHMKDFTEVNPIPVSAKDFIAEGILIYRNYNVNDLKKYIHFHNFITGELHDDEIASVEISGINTKVYLADPAGVPWQISSANTIISWLDKVRLVRDKVTMKWERVGILESTPTFITVED